MANKERYILTTKLIKVAISNGMTQTEIAKKCRVNQPQVSKWLNGYEKATIQQLTPIIELFEHEVVRRSSELYYNFNEETKKNTYYKVIGDIIFKQELYKHDKDATRGNNTVLEKIVVHEKNRNVFTLVHSKPGVLYPDFISKDNSFSMYNSTENIYWSEVHECEDINSLINYIDNIANRKSTFYYDELGQIKNEDNDVKLQRQLMEVSLDEFKNIRSAQLKKAYLKDIQSIENGDSSSLFIPKVTSKDRKLSYTQALDELEQNAEDMYAKTQDKARKQFELLEKLPEVIFPERMDLYIQLPFLIRKALIKRGYNIEGINHI